MPNEATLVVRLMEPNTEALNVLVHNEDLAFSFRLSDGMVIATTYAWGVAFFEKVVEQLEAAGALFTYRIGR